MSGAISSGRETPPGRAPITGVQFVWPLCLGIAAFLYVAYAYAPVPVDISGFELMPVLGILAFFFLLAAVIERVVETLLVILLRSRELDLDRQIEAAQRRDGMMSERMEQLLNLPLTADEKSDMVVMLADTNPAQSAVDLAQNLDMFAQQDGALKILKSRIAVSASLVLSGAIYLSGFGLLHGIISTYPDALVVFSQSDLLMPLDALVTILLLAGGAEGVHKLAKRIMQFIPMG